MKTIPLAEGDRFGRLLVKSFSHRSRKPYYNCICDCGKSVVVEENCLKTGNTKSCGCLSLDLLQERNFKHGKSKSPVFYTWASMIQRCTNPKNPSYKNYGGRGITVDESWLEFSNFYADMGDRTEGLSLDRIDNSKGYSKDNCRWADMKTQSRNMRSNVFIEYAGKRLCLTDWANIIGIDPDRLHWRIKRWTLERAFTHNVPNKLVGITG